MIINKTLSSLTLSLGNLTAFGIRKNMFINSIAFGFSKMTDLEKLSKGGPKMVDDIIPDINKPRSSDGGIFSVQRVIEKEQVSQEIKERMEDLRQRHELLRVELAKKINIPFLLCGINRKTYHESYGYLPERVMSYYKIHPTIITDFLLKIYKASLYAMIDNNQDFMKEYWEQGFKESVKKSLQVAKQKKYDVKVTEEKKFVQQMRESCRIVDAFMLRGLSMNRNENEHPKNYHKYAEDKQFGLVTYTPLYLTEDNQKFSNPQTNKTVYQGYERMVLRILVLIKTPIRLTVPELPIPTQLNTYEHLAIFENQMLAPPPMQSRYKLQTLVQWLGKYRFGPWKLVDIDNYMKGNSPFRNHFKEEELEEIFQNTILDKSYYCNIRNI